MLGVRLDAETERQLDAVARRLGRSKSEIVRDALVRYLADDTFAAEARRQSLLASGRLNDDDAAFALALVDVDEAS